MPEKEKTEAGFTRLISSKKVEYTFLILFILLFLVLGFANIKEYKINNDYPVGMHASDPFHYYNYIEGLEERGKFDYFPYYVSFNLSTMIAAQPPLFYTNSVILGNVFDTENYNATHLLLAIFFASGIMLLYFTIRRHNAKIAIMSLPLTLFIFAPNFIFGIIWGRTPTMWTEVFIIGIFWLLPILKEYRTSLALALLVSGLFLGHTPQFLFGVAYIALFFIVRIIQQRKIPIKTIKILGIAVLLALIFIGYYYPVFHNTLRKTMPLQIEKILSDAQGNRYVSFWEFKYFGAFILLGAASFFLVKKKENLMFGVFMLSVGFTNYFLGKRGIETRFMWPIFLMVLLGLSLYFILRFIKLNKKPVAYAIAIIMMALFYFTIYTPGLGRGSLANPYIWDSFHKLQETPERTEVLFVYGDGFDQSAMLIASKRLAYSIPSYTLNDLYNEKRFPRKVTTLMSGEGVSRGAYKKDGKVRFYYDEGLETGKKRDICQFDYYVFAKAGRAPHLAQFSSAVAGYLVQNAGFERYYENALIYILHNKNRSVECMTEEGIPFEQ